MVKDIHDGRYMVKYTKLQKTLKNKFKLFCHVINHGPYCSKIVINDSHHLPDEYLQFLCIKTLSLQKVYEISSEWFEALQLAGSIGVH